MPRALLIGLDAFPPGRLEAWIADGTLPNFLRLAERGRYGRVSSEADLYPASVWSTFNTQSGVADHGINHLEMWDAASQRIRPPTADWLPTIPFWRKLAARGMPVVAFDVPFSDDPAPQANVVEVLGWGMHHRLWRRSHPFGLLKQLETRDGAAQQRGEAPDTGRSDDEIAKELPSLMTDVRRRVSHIEYLARAYDWQLMIASFSEPHRAGHWFWSGRGTGVPQGGVKAVAVEIDNQLPRIEALLQPSDQLAIFSLHGMRATIDADRVGQAMTRYLEPTLQSTEVLRRDPIYLLRHKLPPNLMRAIVHRLPYQLHNWAYFHLRNTGRDWSQLGYVVNPLDDITYVTMNPSLSDTAEDRQVNEAELLRRIEGMTTPDGRKVVAKIVRPRETMSGARAGYLPDLIVISNQSGIGPRIRTVDGVEHTVQRNSDRDGEHDAEGFYLQVGDGIPAGSTGDIVAGIDLASFLCQPAGISI